MATTQKKPARAPRKPARASDPAKGRNRAQKPAIGRKPAKAAGPAKPNPFDAIARQVNADQEAKDREAGRDDLTPALAKSFDQAKAKRSGTGRAATKPAKPVRPAKPTPPPKPAKPTTPARPARPSKVNANGNRKTFAGRPVSDPAKVAARAKQLGLRVRADADIDALATRLRATPAAIQGWLDSRNGQQPAKVTTKAPAKTTAKAKAKTTPAPSGPVVVVGEEVITHPWADKTPDYLRGCSLVVKWSLDSDGFVWSQLVTIRDQDGHIMRDAKDLPLDFRRHQDRDVNNRATKLKGSLDPAALRGWLVRQGLATPADIETNTTK
jgi:hypothetical protein